MEAVILAGGFGTRLLPLTKHVPKALLTVAGKPVIDFQVEQLVCIPEIDRIIVSTNARFEDCFRDWWLRLPLRTREVTRLVVEPSMKENEKLGSVGGLQHVVESQSLGNSELVVTAGDNLFDFPLRDLVSFYRRRNSATVAFCDLQYVERVRGRYGVGILGEDGAITAFEEKPEIPMSTLAATGCYVFTASLVEDLREYTSQATKVDAFGHFIGWLSKRSTVCGFVFSGSWFDIGSFDSYEAAIAHYTGKTTAEVGAL